MKALILLLTLTLVAAAQMPTCAVIPGSTQKGDARAFEVETLFDYMNGNSEGYFLYGFQKMAGITCQKGGVDLIFDVSTFTDVESAYGMFTGNADPRVPVEAIGAGGQVTPRKAVFAKDRYYVEIAAEPDGEHSHLLRNAIAAFEKTLAGCTNLPVQLSWFPKEGLEAGFPRLAPQSVLGLRLLKRGYLAHYAHGKAFVVTEASEAEAAALMAKLRERFPPKGETMAGNESFVAEDRYLGSLSFFRKGSHVGGWANVKDADAAALAGQLAASIR
ncbi:MAG: hypothetical protein KIT83_16350 [Bryobacterales bacterium]|nr:hypothetical protein [Bryobacterales bacterium]